MSNAIELEADFVKALRLLHSRAKDSADILKSMLDEVLKQKTIQSNAKTVSFLIIYSVFKLKSIKINSILYLGH
jgi:hypothetical protein